MKKGLSDYSEVLGKEDFITNVSLSLQMLLRDMLGYTNGYWAAIKLYRQLTYFGLLKGSSTGSEISGIKIPKDYLKSITPSQCKRGIKEILRISQNLEKRAIIGQYYERLFRDLSLKPAEIPFYATHTFIKYPVLVRDRDYIFEKAKKYNIPLHDWFMSGIHPIE